MKRRFSYTRIRKWIPAFAGMTVDTLDWEGTTPSKGYFNSLMRAS